MVKTSKKPQALIKNDWRFTVDKFYTKKYQERNLREGDPGKFRELAASIAPKVNYAQRLTASSIDYMSKVPSRDKR